MKKILIAIGLIALIALFVVGCNTKSASTDEKLDANGNDQTIAGDQATTTQVSIDVESIDSDLNDPELEDTEQMLDEMSW